MFTDRINTLERRQGTATGRALEVFGSLKNPIVRCGAEHVA